MAVTDLTNTKWLFNNEPTMEQFGYLYLNFSSNNTNYTGINIVNASRYIGMQYDLTDAYIGYSETTSSTGWQNEEYKTIEITGGIDVTNASLISWLTANATQIIETGGSMYLGTSNISKMYIGQNEVEKVYFGQDLVYEKQASLPTFTIVHPYTAEETTYQFEDGMTWLQWVNSAYNTDSYFVYPDNTKVFKDDISWIATYTSPSAYINKNDLIVAGNYTLEIDN